MRNGVLLYEKFVRPRLFGLSADPEVAHDWVIRHLERVHQHPLLLKGMRMVMGSDYPELAQDIMGLHFPNPVGLPGGMDKNARVPGIWSAMGFGFSELGTIVAQDQPGNPQPRIFRLEEDRALINRMGFNSDGVAVVAERLQGHALRGKLPSEPLFINIGKSKTVPLDSAIDDYIASLKKLFKYPFVIVINVSSPNTLDLRQLQDARRLRELLTALTVHNKLLASEHGIKPKPFLVKIAPDLSRDAIDDVLDICSREQIAGIIATNTTIERSNLKSPDIKKRQEGGLSGPPLFEKALSIVRYIRQNVNEDFVIIGVGGISGPQDAWDMLRSGANLIQIYTAFVYEGPFLPKLINQGLRHKLRMYNFKNISEVKTLWPKP